MTRRASRLRPGGMPGNALSAALATGLTMAMVSAFPASDASPTTGPYLDSDRATGLQALIVLDRETIELSGKTSVADLLRDLPYNNFGSPRSQSGSSAQSFAGLSLRGLGVGRTLILLDGRRLPVAPSTGEGQNLEAVPLAAVERIEILPAGGSATHGSDAIGGVVNIITRKDFTGAKLTIGLSDPERQGGATEQGSALFGAAGERGRVMAGVSYNARDIVFAREREWSRGGASIFSNNFLNTNFTFLEHPQFGSANVVGCQGPGFSVRGQGPNTRCFHDPTLESADEAATRNESLFFRAGYDIDGGWTIVAKGRISRVKSFGRQAPVPSAPWLAGGFEAILLAPGLPNHPATPPDQGGLNPLWQDYQDRADDSLLVTHRFAANGPRDTHTDANTYDIHVGLQGHVGTWDIEFGGRWIDSQHYELGRNYILSELAQPAIDRGGYNVYDPFGVPEEALESFTTTISRDARTLQKEIYVSASTDLPLKLGAGPVGVTLGGEYRQEGYEDIFDSLQVAGTVTGSGTAPGPALADRSAWAVHGEVLIPLRDNLELTGALRHSDYSDVGSANSFNVAFGWQLVDRVALRGRWGTSFRAPSLKLQGRAPAFSREFVVDEATFALLPSGPPPVFDLPTFSIANPALSFERADTYRISVAMQPFDRLNAEVAYWRTALTDRFALIGAQQVINCDTGETQRCPPGLNSLPWDVEPPVPALGLGVARDPETGALIYGQVGYVNLGTIDSDGLDIMASARFDVGSASLKSSLLATYTNRFEVDGGEDVAGDAGGPKWRAVLSNVYRIGDFAFSWYLNHIGDQDSSLAMGQEGSLPSWTTHDVQVNWDAPWNGRITVGVDNLADKDPVLDLGEDRGFNFDLYDGYGRIVYLRYKQNW